MVKMIKLNLQFFGSTGKTSQTQSYVQPTVVTSQNQASTANDDTFSATDDSDYHELLGGRAYYQSQTFNIDTMLAIQDYLNDQPVNGLYSPSQNLNYAMEHGQPLTANQQYMVDSLMEGMHNLGQNLTLTHFGRVSLIDGFAQNAGITGIDSSNFGSMSEAQLQKAFVGTTHGLNKFLSVSHNEFRKAPNGGRPFTDKAVKLNIKAPAKTQALMPGNGPGGALGEFVLAPGQNIRITGVRFTGKSGRSGSQTYKQVEFDVEFY